jgi:hypothetical protein
MKNPTRKRNEFEAPVGDVKLVGMRGWHKGVGGRESENNLLWYMYESISMFSGFWVYKIQSAMPLSKKPQNSIKLYICKTGQAYN